MATRHFDVAILGGGNAGMGATIATREAGLSVAVLEPWVMGGTCSNRGCTPKKVLVAAAHALDDIARAGAHRIEVGAARLDWGGLIRREKEIIAPLPDRFRDSLVERGVTLIETAGRFTGPQTIAAGDDTIAAEHIVVATGSKPRALPFAGAGLMLTSDDVLSEEQLPAHVVFVGGGAIAFEFAHVYRRAGSSVTILEAGDRFLKNFDADAVDQVVGETRRIGIDARAGVKVAAIEKAGGRLRVVFEAEGREQAIAADRVVNGAGRVPALDGLGLEAAGIGTDGRRILADAHLRSTSNRHAWACGDALAGKPQLSPIATYEGTIVGRNITGAGESPAYRPIPACLYTIPSLATVGLTEAEARKAGGDPAVETSDMSDWLSARTYAESAAWAKVIVARDSGLILGAHIVGHGGEELIHLFAMAMRHGIPASDMKEAVYAFPTFSADIRSML